MLECDSCGVIQTTLEAKRYLKIWIVFNLHVNCAKIGEQVTIFKLIFLEWDYPVAWILCVRRGVAKINITSCNLTPNCRLCCFLAFSLQHRHYQQTMWLSKLLMTQSGWLSEKIPQHAHFATCLWPSFCFLFLFVFHHSFFYDCGTSGQFRQRSLEKPREFLTSWIPFQMLDQHFQSIIM